MSKRSGNFVTLSDKAVEKDVVRFIMLIEETINL